MTFRFVPIGLLFGLVVSVPARAQLFSGESEFRSDEAWAFELRLGPYSPDVDAEVGADPGPHEIYFGNSPRLMVQAELDRELFKFFGTFSIGARVGYTRETASALVNLSVLDKTTPRAGDSTSLTIVPTSLLAVYRFDFAARRWGIPLVPYGKVGFDYVLYWIRNGDDEVATSTNFGGSGRGATTGWNAAVGLSLLLDVFDIGAARELDTVTGINHTYLFGELVHHDDSGLFGSDRMRLGDTTWFAGLMFEF